MFQVHAKLEDSEEASLSAELASRMALIDATDMEEEPDASAGPVDKVISDIFQF